MPAEDTRPDEVAPTVAGLMTALIGRGLRVLAQSDYAEQLPGGGEIAPTPAAR
jgi:hypothetical protein